MSLLYRALPTNHFARGVSIQVGGTVGAQAIMVLAAPLLTRLFSPEDFGLLAVFAAMLSIVSVIAALRYELAIPLPEEDRDAAALAILAFCVLLAMSALVAIPVLLYPGLLARMLNEPRLADYFYLVPVGMLFIGLYNIMNFWAVRVKEFSAVAKTKFSQSLSAVLIQLGGAPLGPVSLLLGHLAGHAVGSVSLCVRVLRERWHIISGVRAADVIRIAARYKQFPLYSTWSAICNVSGAQLPPILFATLFSPAIAGIYALANRVLSMPMQLLSQAIANVLVGNAIQAHRDGRLDVLMARVHGHLAHIGMPPVLILLFGGPYVFRLVFGPEWRQAGVFVQWMCPFLYLVFITSPLSMVYEVVDRLGVDMLIEAIQLVVRIAAIAVGAWIGDAITAIAFFAAGSAACRLIYLAGVMRVSGMRWQQVGRQTLSALGWSAILASPVIVCVMSDARPAFQGAALAATLLLITARYGYLMRKAWA